MNKLRIAALAAMTLVLGCSGSPHENLMDEQVQTIEGATKLILGIKDEDTAAKARPELMKILTRIEEQNQRARAMKELTPEQIQALEQRSTDALKRLNDAAREARNGPGGDVVREFITKLRNLP